MIFLPRGRIWLAFTPFLIALTLLVLLMLYPFTGIGPNSNIFAGSALIAIILGLVVGAISLFVAKTIRVWWRLLIGVLYLPTAVFSLLLAGF